MFSYVNGMSVFVIYRLKNLGDDGKTVQALCRSPAEQRLVLTGTLSSMHVTVPKCSSLRCWCMCIG